MTHPPFFLLPHFILFTFSFLLVFSLQSHDSSSQICRDVNIYMLCIYVEKKKEKKNEKLDGYNAGVDEPLEVLFLKHVIKF